MTLEMETATYRRRRKELVAKHPGEFVLIHQDEVVGTYHTQRAALEAGYARFGYVDLFTKQLLASEPQVVVAARTATRRATHDHA